MADSEMKIEKEAHLSTKYMLHDAQLTIGWQHQMMSQLMTSYIMNKQVICNQTNYIFNLKSESLLSLENNKDLQKDLANMRAELDKSSRSNSLLSDQLSIFKDNSKSCRKIESLNENLLKENKALQEEIISLKTYQASMVENIEDLKKNISEKTSDINNLKNSSRCLNNKYCKIKSEYSTLESAKADMAKEYDETLNNFKNEICVLQNKQRNVDKSYAHKISAISKSKDSLEDELLMTRSNNKKAAAAIRNLRGSIEEKELEIQSYSDDLFKAHMELNNLHPRILLMQTATDDWQNSFEKFVSEYNQASPYDSINELLVRLTSSSKKIVDRPALTDLCLQILFSCIKKSKSSNESKIV